MGPWLHQVACRTASCLRRTVIRRRTHERRLAEREPFRSVEVGTSRDPDQDAAIHEEVNRLPEKYRAPVVLCDLEGRTHREAARFLGWPIGTVKSRQAQARELLRERLARRGLGPDGAVAVAESPRPSIQAVIPKELSRSTAMAAMQQAGRLMKGFAVSSQVLTLTQGVLRAMLWIRVRFLAFAAIVLGIASSGASVYVCGSQEPATKDGQSASERPTASPDPRLSRKTAAEPPTDASRARLKAQRLAARKAKATYEIARLTRELAEIAVEEYRDLTYPKDLATVEGEIKLAESDLTRGEDRLEWARRMQAKGYVSQAQKVSEELSLKKAQFALEQAQSKRKILVDYTRGKTLKELQSDVEKAHANELFEKQVWETEEARAAELERQFLSNTR